MIEVAYHLIRRAFQIPRTQLLNFPHVWRQLPHRGQINITPRVIPIKVMIIFMCILEMSHTCLLRQLISVSTVVLL